MKNIKITLRDIVGVNGKDNTGALTELGFQYKDPRDRDKWDSTVFLVDLDFIIRHGRYNASGPNGDMDLYKEHYKGSPQYMKYYEEGKQAFFDRKDDPLDNPYTNSNLVNDSDEYWLNKLVGRGYPWYDGYRETEAKFNEDKYKIKEFKKEVKKLAEKYDFKIEHEDEYGYPYLVTPDGFRLDFA